MSLSAKCVDMVLRSNVEVESLLREPGECHGQTKAPESADEHIFRDWLLLGFLETQNGFCRNQKADSSRLTGQDEREDQRSLEAAYLLTAILQACFDDLSEFFVPGNELFGDRAHKKTNSQNYRDKSAQPDDPAPSIPGKGGHPTQTHGCRCNGPQGKEVCRLIPREGFRRVLAAALDQIDQRMDQRHGDRNLPSAPLLQEDVNQCPVSSGVDEQHPPSRFVLRHPIRLKKKISEDVSCDQNDKKSQHRTRASLTVCNA
jgi:hypothetical protein